MEKKISSHCGQNILFIIITLCVLFIYRIDYKKLQNNGKLKKNLFLRFLYFNTRA